MFKDLINWSESEFSYLPWRKKRSLYGTLVSEIMLQQTTVGTVLNHFDRFLTLYPTIEELSKATEDEICIAWKGLGYYRRARNLLKAAQYIANEYKGKVPLDKNKLLSIPGIGEYTANAILSIGADVKALSVDANLERVLSRFYGLKEQKGVKLQKKLKKEFEEGKILKKMDRLGSRKVNEALMDLGRNFCQARRVECQLCHLSKDCKARKLGNPLDYPIELEKIKKESYELHLLRIIIINKGKVLSYKKDKKEWLAGQIEPPTFIISCEDKKLKQYPKASFEIDIENTFKIKGAITKYKVTNFVVKMTSAEFRSLKLANSENYQFETIDTKKINFSSTTLKIFKKLNLLT